MARLHPFRFGIICEQMSSAQGWVSKAKLAEHSGYSTFLIRDHLIREPFGDQLAPLIALMAAAGATRTLRIGSLVLDNDYRHPVMLAKEAATLDLLSGGRLELGIGAGWLRAEYEQAGMPFDAPGVRVSRLEEALQVLKGLFADQPFTFSGRHYTVTDLNGFPKTYQRPYPPILVGAGSKRMLALAGREANIVGILARALPNGTISEELTERLPATLAQKVEWVRQAAGARFDEIELSMVVTPHFSQHRQQKAAQLMQERGWNGISTEQVLEMPSIFIGTMGQMMEKMQQLRKQYGFSYFVISDRYMEDFAPIVAEL
ncbi:MAG: TIGR03621 family F420-dependent LLM class oxidoreductase, partial [Ktedonobacteraceae bacterium]|nr:TIGR03621 family F420-dependent LLM class oxidoreductase [Ktedonobacteraceae bacterium]